jgi:hypothetical protein
VRQFPLRYDAAREPLQQGNFSSHSVRVSSFNVLLVLERFLWRSRVNKTALRDAVLLHLVRGACFRLFGLGRNTGALPCYIQVIDQNVRLSFTDVL